MKNKIQIISIVALLFSATFLFTSCKDSLDDISSWRLQNENAFKNYEKEEGYEKVTIDGFAPFVYVKWFEKVERNSKSVFPIETSRVVIHYQLSRIVGDTSIIETNYDNEAGTFFSLNRGASEQIIVGLRIALQNMLVGDEAEVIIPWFLAYGQHGGKSIRPYTALKYRVRLDEIIPEERP